MTTNTNGGGEGLTLLTIAFVVLKLTHVINWSWWWVLSPVWMSVIVAVVVIGVVWLVTR